MRKLMPHSMPNPPRGGRIATELPGDAFVIEIGRLGGRRQPERIFEYNYKIRYKNII